MKTYIIDGIEVNIPEYVVEEDNVITITEGEFEGVSLRYSNTKLKGDILKFDFDLSVEFSPVLERLAGDILICLLMEQVENEKHQDN